MLRENLKHNSISVIKWFINNYIFLLAGLTWVLTLVFKKYSYLTEVLYSKSVYVFISNILSRISGIFPFSLNDLLYSVLVVLFFATLVLVIARKRTIKKALLNLLKLLALFYILFYWLWGFNYFRSSVYSRMNFTPEMVGDSLFVSTFKSLVFNATQTYSSDTLWDTKGLDNDIEDSYKSLAKQLNINYPNGNRRPKKMFYSRYNAGAGISGYFGPFSNEIHMNKYLPKKLYPVILAHEKAHQFGVTSEAEASFYAFLVCRNSNRKELVYSANLYLILYFLRQIDREQRDQFTKLLPKPIITDILTIREFWNKMQLPLINKVQSKLYDIYLKGNNIPDGVKNYGGVVKLVCEYDSQTTIY